MMTMMMYWMRFTNIGLVDMEERGLQFELDPISEAYLDAWDEWLEANVDMYSASPGEGARNV